MALLVFGRGPDRRTLTAEFTDVRGLVTGAEVRLAGVDVGEVQRIWLGPDGWPRVQMSVDPDVTPARAAVRLASLSGEFNRYVSVVQGGVGGTASSFIPLSHTTSPVEVDDALSTFDPKTEAALRSVLAGLRRTLDGQGPALAATLRRSQSALDQVAGLAADVGGDGSALQLAVHSTKVIATTLATRAPALASAVENAAALMHTLAGNADALAASLHTLPPGLDATGGTLARLRATIAPADRLLRTAAPAVAQLPATANELRAALRAAVPTLTQASLLAAQAPPAAETFTPVLQAAGPLLSVMIPVLHRIGPMLDELRVRLPDAFSFFANWADFTSNYDANGHGARVGIVLPPAPENDQLAPPYLRTPGSLESQPWTDYRKSFVFGGRH